MVFGKGSKNKRNESSSSGEYTPLKKSMKKSAVHKPNMEKDQELGDLNEHVMGEVDMDVIWKEVKDIKLGQTNILKKFEKKIDQLGARLTTDFTKQCYELKKDLKKDLSEMNSRVNSLEQRIVKLEKNKNGISKSFGDPLENTDVTIIVTNVFQHPNEDPLETAHLMVSAIGKDENNKKIASQVVITAAKHLPNRNQKGPGLLKISFTDLEEKKYILRHKSLLKNTTGYEWVFLLM